ncbi:MAG: ATP synthase F1 subunit epsilon [Lentimicrobiaceae bacterium]|nr:ATP synthase F1 subunit epsilon [Lentimicrobiaceae bacterium]
MKLDIIVPEKTLYSGNVHLVQLPGVSGSFEILDNHAPMIAALKEGTIRIVDLQRNTQYVKITGGILKVKQNEVIILAE